MIEAFRDIILSAVPPKDSNPERQYYWRWSVFVLLLASLSATGIHIALSCGYIPRVFKGFASADELDKTNQKINIIIQSDTKRDIRDLQTKMCNAEYMHNVLGRDFARHELEDALNRWLVNTGFSYPELPSCDQVRTVGFN